MKSSGNSPRSEGLSLCCCEAKHSACRLTEEDLLLAAKANTLKFHNFSPKDILQVSRHALTQAVKRYSFNGRISVAALQELDKDLAGISLTTEAHNLRWLFYALFIFSPPRSNTSAGAALALEPYRPPPADRSGQESSARQDPLMDPSTQLDALKLSTSLIYMSRASQTERALALFSSYDHLAERHLTQHQLKFLFRNSFFLVATALPSLFLGKERGAGSIANQAKAMQKRVQAQTLEIVSKLVKMHLRRKRDNQDSLLMRLPVSPGRRAMAAKQSRPEVKISKQDFLAFFRKSEKNSTLLSVQGLRDCAIPMTMSNGSFRVYKAAGKVASGAKGVSPPKPRLLKKQFREQWHDNAESTSSLVMGGIRLTGSMMRSQESSSFLKQVPLQESHGEELSWSLSKRSEHSSSRSSGKRVTIARRIYDEDYK